MKYLFPTDHHCEFKTDFDSLVSTMSPIKNSAITFHTESGCCGPWNPMLESPIKIFEKLTTNVSLMKSTSEDQMS